MNDGPLGAATVNWRHKLYGIVAEHRANAVDTVCQWFEAVSRVFNCTNRHEIILNTQD